MKLRLDDGAALQVILLTNKEGSGWFAVVDAELVREDDFKLLCSQILFVCGIVSLKAMEGSAFIVELGLSCCLSKVVQIYEKLH